MTSSVNSSRSPSPTPVGDLADNAPEGQSAAGSSSTPSQAASAPHPSILRAGRRGSAAFLATQAEHATTSGSVVASDPNALNSQGSTPLIQAFEDGNLQEFRRLLKDDRVDVNRPDASHRSPLLAACMGKPHLGIGPEETLIFVEELLKSPGIDVNAADPSGLTPLHAACRQNALGAVEALLKADGIVADARNNQEDTPLDIALDERHEQLITVLFKTSSVVLRQTDENNRTLLHRLIERRFKNAIPALVALAPELASTGDNSGTTPLHEAAQLENPDIIQMLLARDEVNVNPINNEMCTPLHIAAFRGRTRAVKALLDREGVNLNAMDMRNRTPLHYAILADRTDTAKMLLEEERVNVNAPDGDGATPLHVAASAQRAQIGKLLLARGDLNLNMKLIKGGTPFNVAVDRCPPLAMEMLKVPYELNENGMLAENSLRPDDAERHEITPLQIALNWATSTNDPERWSFFNQLLNDPRVDSNRMLDLLRTSEDRTLEKVLDTLKSIGFERSEESLFAVLHEWANKRPVGARQNQALAAKTNFYLGTLYRSMEASRQGLSDLEKLEFQLKALFHHALALEQLLKHPEQSERVMGLEHNEAVDGTDSISNYARKLLDTVSAVDELRFAAAKLPPYTIWNRRIVPLHRGDQFDVTLDMFELTIADDTVTRTEAVNIGGICVPCADIEDLASGRGHKAMQLALLADEHVGRDRNVHQIGHLMTGVMMLDAVRNKNADVIARLNDAPSSSAAAQTHAVSPFAVAADEARAEIARVKGVCELKDEPTDVTRARLMRLEDAAAAIDRIAGMPAGGAINERELSTTVQDVFREMWFYIKNSPNEMRQNLEEAFFYQLADMWSKGGATLQFHCLTGCVQRLLSVPHHIDPSLMTSTRNLSPQEMTSGLQELARDVLRPIHMAYHLAGNAEILEDEEHLNVQRGIFEATAREIMIGFRGWEDSPKVREAIDTMKENIEYISVVTEDTQEA